MDVKNLVMAVIALLLGAVMIAGALLPSVASVTDDNIDVFNNSLVSAPSVSIYDNHTGVTTIEYIPGESNLSINGEEYDLSIYDGNMFWSDKGYVIVSQSISLPDQYYGRVVDDNGIHSGTSATTKLTIVIENMNVTITRDGAGDTYNLGTCGWVAFADPVGNYKIISGGLSTGYYISSDNEILGYTYFDNVGGADYRGTMLNFHDDENVGSMTIIKEKVEGYTDLYHVSRYNDYKISAESTVLGGRSPYFYLVPYEVEATTELGAIVNPLFGIIPIIAVAGLVMAGIYVFISRK